MKQTDFDMIQTCAKGFTERATALGLKPTTKRYADEAISYSVGFAKALTAAGYDTTPLTAWIGFDLAFRAPKAIEESTR